MLLRNVATQRLWCCFISHCADGVVTGAVAQCTLPLDERQVPLSRVLSRQVQALTNSSADLVCQLNPTKSQR